MEAFYPSFLLIIKAFNVQSMETSNLSLETVDCVSVHVVHIGSICCIVTKISFYNMILQVYSSKQLYLNKPWKKCTSKSQP